MTTLEPRTTLRPARLLPVSSPATTTGGAVSDSLTRTVQAAVRKLDETELRRVAAVEAGLAFQPKTLMALLTYCYVKEIYGSADVEDVMRRDANFRQLCQNEFPGARLLRRFRCENRGALHDCLAEVLFTRAQQYSEGAGAEALTETGCAEEATRRLCTAMFMDQMALDDA